MYKRQALYALEHNVSRLPDDHEHAALIASTLQSAGVRLKLPRVPTNIVVIETPSASRPLADQLAERGVLVTVMGPLTLRCVTHLGVDRAASERAASVLASVLQLA